jgi:hypothetical protein
VVPRELGTLNRTGRLLTKTWFGAAVLACLALFPAVATGLEEPPVQTPAQRARIRFMRQHCTREYADFPEERTRHAHGIYVTSAEVRRPMQLPTSQTGIGGSTEFTIRYRWRLAPNMRLCGIVGGWEEGPPALLTPTKATAQGGEFLEPYEWFYLSTTLRGEPGERGTIVDFEVFAERKH